MQLYQIASQYRELEGMLDCPDADMEDIARHMNDCDDAMREKVINISMLIRNMEVASDAMRDAESKMAQRRKSAESRIAWLKNYVISAMQFVGMGKVECEHFNVSIRANPPSVVIDDESLIPQEYMRVPDPPKPAPDKKKILDDMKRGVKIDGAHAESGVSLSIR